jgi:hypothetical protein
MNTFFDIRKLSLGLALLWAPFSAYAAISSESLSMPMNSEHTLIVNNRILATVNGKKISVLDVMKKMDVFLNQHYPQYADSIMARYQFYNAHWQETLNRLIDAELILMDAEGKDLKISEGDVRETIHDKFGPNVMTTLDKLGLTYEEAREMIHTDLMVQRMMWFKVNSPAFLAVNPEKVKDAYKMYCTQNPPSEEWSYQVLSVRSKDSKKAEDTAYEAYSALINGKTEPSIVVSVLQKKLQAPQEEVGAATLTVNVKPTPQEVMLSLSEEQQADSKSISSAHREVLTSLEPGAFSLPILQKSRVDNSAVYRIFFLKKYEKKDPLIFHEISDKLENELLQTAMDQEGDSYTKKLRKKYSFDADTTATSDNFNPFVLK